MLTIELFGNAARAISAARSITSLLETAAGQNHGILGDRHVDVFAREQLLKILLQQADAGVDDHVVVLAGVAAPDDQADGAGALAVDQDLARS